MKVLVLVLVFATLGSSNTNLNNLINKLKKESELSKITKQDTAGVISTFTRDDLEKINATTLKDLINVIPLVNLSRNDNGEYVVLSPGAGFLSSSNIRIYLNDHELSSGYHAGAMAIWSNLSLEFIDHVEVYRGTSTIEFGNISGVLVIRLYTKKASREDGGKIKLSGNTKDLKIDTYYGYSLTDNNSIFVYANKGKFKNEEYIFNGKNKSNNTKDTTAYLDAKINNINVEIAQYNSKSGAFLISGQNNNLQENTHSYINISKYFDDKSTKVRFSYDNIKYKKYLTESSFYAGDLGVISKVNALSNDDDMMISIERNINLKLNKLFIGAFYKVKKFHVEGSFENTDVDFKNELKIGSVYIQDKNELSDHSILVVSLKNDNYSYEKEIKTTNKLTSKIGLITKIDNLMYKLFYTKGYQEIPLYQLYTQNNIPFKTNKDLKTPAMSILSSYLEYKINKSIISLEYFSNTVEDSIYFKLPPLGDGQFKNDPQTITMNWLVFKNEYYFDEDNKILISYYRGNNTKSYDFSPKEGMKILLFNKYKKFSFYNELIFSSKYKQYNQKVDSSYTYSMNINYNYTKDLSFSIKGENIFNNGYKQTYKNIPEPIKVKDKKIYLGMEYLF